MEAASDWNFLTPLGPLLSLTSCTSPASSKPGHFHVTVVPRETVSVLGV